MADDKNYTVMVNLPAKMGGEAIATVLTQVMDQHKYRQQIVAGIGCEAVIMTVGSAGEPVYVFTLTMTPA